MENAQDFVSCLLADIVDRVSDLLSAATAMNVCGQMILAPLDLRLESQTLRAKP